MSSKVYDFALLSYFGVVKCSPPSILYSIFASPLPVSVTFTDTLNDVSVTYVTSILFIVGASSSFKIVVPSLAIVVPFKESILFCPSSCAFSMFAFISFAFATIPLSPVTRDIVAPARIIITIIVTVKEIKVIPCSFLIVFISYLSIKFLGLSIICYSPYIYYFLLYSKDFIFSTKKIN